MCRLLSVIRFFLSGNFEKNLTSATAVFGLIVTISFLSLLFLFTIQNLARFNYGCLIPLNLTPNLTLTLNPREWGVGGN